ncbi:sulfatase [Sphingobacterium alkalisoli]|uniref:Sulfatase n=1 Tax=Sphingobacterium alkalisoli TaxID=1874115 RepID=A0A4U0GTP8_9SPHI|nr:alkaline phosphatase family protein [Sphingobacterium alkalisoli]TJY62431.1 sulfatase [Sphingobacterium alkalisoli]GGH29530.1 sulfatase [Sphingobacterium alkalisoli]
MIGNVKQQYKSVYFLLLYFVFWLFIAWIDRLLFLLFAAPVNTGFTFQEILRVYSAGFKLDLSMTAYICVLPFIGYFLWSLFPNWSFSTKWIRIYTYSILIILGFLSCISVNLYTEWTDKISRRAIETFFETPQEAFLSASSTNLWIPLLVFVVVTIVGSTVFSLLFRLAFVKFKTHFTLHILGFFVGLIFLFTCIRGGYSTSPLNESMAYYSSNQFYNHAAVNTHWSFVNDLVNSASSGNPYQYFKDSSDIDLILTPVFPEKRDPSVSILNTERPNVVLILLESFTADLIENLGGEKEVTPYLDQISREGLSFTQFYAAADRSDKGIIGVFSSFPAQGKESIIKSIKKHEKLAGIGQEIHNAGYHTSFYYGGQSEFYNFKSYMMSHGINRVVDMADFPSSYNESSWGVYDHHVFERILADLNHEKTPFFSTVFTISNHEPFDLKTTYKFGNNVTANKFKSTAFYTDSVLNDFFEKAKKESWYKNTLFILTADHGHRLPYDREITDPKRFHIPLIFFGDVLKAQFKGQKINKIMGQVDLASSILNQLHIPSDRYSWSRDVFDTYFTPYAFFNTKHSVGIISENGTLVFDPQSQQVISSSGHEKSLLNILKAYNQKVYAEYLDY